MNEVLRNPNTGAFVRRGANLHPNIPQVQPRSCTGAKNAAPARNREAPDESPATDSAWGGSKKLFGACCTQLRPKVAPITGVGGQLESGRLRVKLTWAEEDVKSWHSKSAHRAENTSMAPVRPHSLQMMRGKWVESPVSRPQLGSPSRRGAPLLNGFLFGSR